MSGSSFAFFAVFFACGSLFGWLSFDQRHHFSEGSTRPAPDGPQRAWQRAGWVLLCSTLWPLMLLAGAFGWWRRRAQTLE